MKISSKGLVIYGVASILSLLIAAWEFNLFGRDFKVPIQYGDPGDTTFTFMGVKTILENGWYFHNPRLAAPLGMDFYDFPLADGFNVLLIKVISLFVNDSGTVINIFFLLTFVLVAITSTFVFRCLKINKVISVTFGVLYAFAPYHLYRGENHLFLSAYYMVPLIILIVLSLLSQDIPFFSKPFSQSESVQSDYHLNLLNTKSLFCIFSCLVVGSTGIYYAFFSCFFIVVACMFTLFNARSYHKYVIISTLILLGLISLSSFLNILPNLVYTYIHGASLEVAQRQINDTERYSLKIVNLLLPTGGVNRFPLLRRLGQYYNNNSLPAIQNENAFAYLGVLASLGFLYLLAIRVFKLGNRESNLIDRLSILNLSAFIFATTGGFAILFSLLISSQIRAYNRISIYINFFALLALALLLDNFFKTHIKTKRSQILFNVVCIIIFAFGIFEQSFPPSTPSTYNYSLIRNRYESDNLFVQSIEQVLPDDAMVFQLPYVAFPEKGECLKMKDYDLFKGYLHSKKLKWSYGTVEGRNNNWYRIITDQPLEQLLAQISALGFSGIYIDRYGYSDNGQQLQTDLEEILNTKPMVSLDQRLMFFDMQEFNKSFLSKYSPEKIQANQEIALNPLILNWKNGFDQVEKPAPESWRWASDKDAILTISNNSSQPRIATLNFSLSTKSSDYSELRIVSDLFLQTLKINSTPLTVSRKITVPPGEHSIHFLSTAKPVDRAKDPRQAFFLVQNFHLTQAEELSIENLPMKVKSYSVLELSCN